MLFGMTRIVHISNFGLLLVFFTPTYHIACAPQCVYDHVTRGFLDKGGNDFFRQLVCELTSVTRTLYLELNHHGGEGRTTRDINGYAIPQSQPSDP